MVLSTQPFSEMSVPDQLAQMRNDLVETRRENAFLRTEIATLKKRFEDHVKEWTA